MLLPYLLNAPSSQNELCLYATLSIIIAPFFSQKQVKHDTALNANVLFWVCSLCMSRQNDDKSYKSKQGRV